MIKKGNITITEYDPEIEWSSANGYRATRKFRGLKSDILGQVPAMRQAGYTFRITPDEDGPFAECTMTAPDAQDGADSSAETELTTTWTVAGNDIEKDLESHPNWLNMAETERELLREYKAGSKKESEVTTTTTHGDNFKTLIKAGTTSYTISQIVVQRTMTVGPGFAGAAAMSNINGIYSASGLSAAENIPATIVFTLLSGYYLKRTPTITQQPNGRFQIVNEWWHADTWSTTLYGGVVA
jgi:hypothetical protein